MLPDVGAGAAGSAPSPGIIDHRARQIPNVQILDHLGRLVAVKLLRPIANAGKPNLRNRLNAVVELGQSHFVSFAGIRRSMSARIISAIQSNVKR